MRLQPLFILVAFVFLVAPAHAVPLPTPISVTISQKDGVYLYDKDSNKLFFTALNTDQYGRNIDEFSNDSFPITLSPNDIPIDNDALDYVAFDQSGVIEIHSRAGLDGAQIDIRYNEKNNQVSCTYEYDSTGGFIGGATSRTDNCNSSKVTSLTSSQVSGETVYILDLSKLCIWDNEGDGICESDLTGGGAWNGEVSSFKISEAGSDDVVVDLPTIGEGGETFKTESIRLDLARKVSNLYNWAVSIGALIALGVIIFGGVLYSASAGNSSRIGEAKTWIQRAIFGLVLLFSSYLILNTLNPDLTKLEDAFLEKNVRIGISGIELSGGGGGLDLPIPPPTCREACISVGHTPSECNSLPDCPEWFCPLGNEGDDWYNYYNSWLEPRNTGKPSPPTCSTGIRDHRGIDVMSGLYSPVFAVESGTVKVIDSDNISGNRLILLGDSGYQYSYYHLSDYAPKFRSISRNQSPTTQRTNLSIRVVASEHIAYNGCTDKEGPNQSLFSYPKDSCPTIPAHVHFQLKNFAACGSNTRSCSKIGAGCYDGYNNPFQFLNLACRNIPIPPSTRDVPRNPGFYDCLQNKEECEI